MPEATAPATTPDPETPETPADQAETSAPPLDQPVTETTEAPLDTAETVEAALDRVENNLAELEDILEQSPPETSPDATSAEAEAIVADAENNAADEAPAGQSQAPATDDSEAVADIATDDGLPSLDEEATEASDANETPDSQEIEEEPETGSQPPTPEGEETSPADETPLDTSKRGFARRLLSLPVNAFVGVLTVLDAPFFFLSPGIKSIIGYAAIATSIMAVATWIVGPRLIQHG